MVRSGICSGLPVLGTTDMPFGISTCICGSTAQPELSDLSKGLESKQRSYSYTGRTKLCCYGCSAEATNRIGKFIVIVWTPSRKGTK